MRSSGLILHSVYPGPNGGNAVSGGGESAGGGGSHRCGEITSALKWRSYVLRIAEGGEI